jgi:CRISPR-associated protein (TIGR03986 family)
MPLKHSNPSKPRIAGGMAYEARAPYNFVPLPNKIVPAREPLTHDRFHSEGLTGYLDCELETCSPVYVRGMMTRGLYEALSEKDELAVEEKKLIAPFFSKNGATTEGFPQPMIPGSTLRGMIRSLIEVVAHGRIRWVAKQPTFTYRAVAAKNDDPLREPYNQALGRFGSRVRAGYLEQRDDKWFIRPAKTPQDMGWPERTCYIKVREKLIGGGDIKDYIRFDSPNYKPQWHRVGFDGFAAKGQAGRRFSPSFFKIAQIGQPEGKYTYRGVLVCSGNMKETGKAGKKPSPRRNHALILEPAGERTTLLEIPQQTIRDYLNGLTPFQKNDLKDYWSEKGWGCLKNGAPVFYVAEGDKVLYFGHSPNFRVPALLPGSNRAATPADFAPEVVQKAERPDLADAIFGWVEEESGPKEQFAGRVFFSDAQFIAAKQGVWLTSEPIAPKTLSTPKPTTFQHYFVQDRSKDHDPDQKSKLANYTTPPQDTEIRGFKRYWHRGESPDILATAKERDKESQLTRIIPLKPGVRFRFRVYFQNLREEELGALWWALALPGETGKTFRHKLGMGKPLGMGAVAISPRLYLSNRRKRYQALFKGDTWEEAAELEDPQRYLEAFEKHVVSELGYQTNPTRLGSLERVRMLLALLRWPGPAPSLTRYMEIEHSTNGDEVNEYAERPVLEDPLAIEKKSAEIAPGETREAPLVREKPVELPIGFKQGFVSEFGLGPFKDFGFIKPVEEGDQLIFVHAMHIAPDSADLKKGDPVQYTVVDGLRWPEARNVSVIRNEPTAVTAGDDQRQQSEPAATEPTPELETMIQAQGVSAQTAHAAVERKREWVTMVKQLQGAKAMVKTEDGTEITCTALPTYPKMQEGERFRADVVRKAGKAESCVFKSLR